MRGFINNGIDAGLRARNQAAIRRFTVHTDIVAADDANYHVTNATAITIINQGSWLVQINQIVLNPDDVIEIPPVNSENGLIDWRMRIRFLIPAPFVDANTYPNLFLGRQIVILVTKQKEFVKV